MLTCDVDFLDYGFGNFWYANGWSTAHRTTAGHGVSSFLYVFESNTVSCSFTDGRKDRRRAKEFLELHDQVQVYYLNVHHVLFTQTPARQALIY
jgi:hypothetical protein